MTKVVTKTMTHAITNRMKKTLSNPTVRALALATLFLISGIGASLLINPAAAAPNASPAAASPSSAAPTALTEAEANWAYTDGNQFAQDFSPQNQINASDVQDLGLSWLFPIAGAPSYLSSVNYFTNPGLDTTPIVYNGTLIFTTVYGLLFALDAANGDIIWQHQLPISINSTAGLGIGSLNLHMHQGAQTFTTSPNLFGGTPTYWVGDNAQILYAIDALTGKFENITNTVPDGGFQYYTGTNSTIDGNSPTSQYSDINPSNIVFNLDKGILITSTETTSSSDAARCYFKGWNMETVPPTNIWTSYCTPPQPNSNAPLDPNFDVSMVNNMTGEAGIFYPGPAYDKGGSIPGTTEVDLKNLSASQLNATLYNDWGYSDQSATCLAADAGMSTGATSQGWGGSWVLDQKTGVAYVNTNNRGPYAGPCNPGPDLWADSILAINSTNGQWIWGFQTSAHDNWDWDCSWYQGLANETINGVVTEVVNKTCKNGYVYQLNAATGKLLWAWTPPQSIEPRCGYCYMQNPLNRTQMTNSWAAPNNASFIADPSELAGFESTASYDPVTNMIYVTSHNVPMLFEFLPLNASDYFTSNGITTVGAVNTAALPDNATTEAINASNGQMVWSHYDGNLGFRGGLTSSGGVLYVPLASGDLLMLNANTGAVLRDFYLGAPMDVTPGIGATANGTEDIFIEIGSGQLFAASSSPGDLIALSLTTAPSSSASATTGTTTVTVSGSTATTTATSVSTVTTGAATVTTTVASSGSTVTATVSGSTITATVSGATATSTVTSGVSSAALYGIAVVAVIFIIATGYLAMRGRSRPAT
jgi:outer membrane protein assembly factor BamB